MTDGQFDLPLAGTLAAVPDNQGSTLNATLNGEPYQAASITAYPKDYLGGQGLTLSRYPASQDDQRDGKNDGR